MTRGTVVRWLPWITTPVIVVLLLVVWQVYVTQADVSAFILPPPSALPAALRRVMSDRMFGRHVATTLVEILGGFGIACVLGIFGGTLLGRSRLLARIVQPFIVAIQVVPKVALIPLFILWFGFGLSSKLLVACVLSFFPILVNTMLGIRSVDPGHRDVMLSFNARRWQSFLWMELPSALPGILAGMELGIVLATIGAVVGEYLGGSVGLGQLAVATLNALDVEGMFAVILLLTGLGLILYGAVAGLRRVLVPWHASVRSD
jgi:NitT/TauT family transport system permease protein